MEIIPTSTGPRRPSAASLSRSGHLPPSHDPVHCWLPPSPISAVLPYFSWLQSRRCRPPSRASNLVVATHRLEPPSSPLPSPVLTVSRRYPPSGASPIPAVLFRSRRLPPLLPHPRRPLPFAPSAAVPAVRRPSLSSPSVISRRCSYIPATLSRSACPPPSPIHAAHHRSYHPLPSTIPAVRRLPPLLPHPPLPLSLAPLAAILAIHRPPLSLPFAVSRRCSHILAALTRSHCLPPFLLPATLLYPLRLPPLLPHPTITAISRRRCTHIPPGNGSNVHFWEDAWIRIIPLSLPFDDLYIMEPKKNCISQWS